MLYYGMENQKSSSHPAAKKCKSTTSSPIWGRQGQWVKYQPEGGCCDEKDDGKCMTDGPEDYYRNEYDLPLHGVGLGFKKRKVLREDNWAEAYIESELAHAEEVNRLYERFRAFDRAYRARLRKMENEYATALEKGYEEAYSILSDFQKEFQAAKTELSRCYEVMAKCCPGELPKGYSQKQCCV